VSAPQTENPQAERPERTTLVLASDVNTWLDSQCILMRQTSGTVMSRSELLRAMVRATIAALAGDDFSKCKTAEDVGIVMFCGVSDPSETQSAA
jgi:hypothetical protein